MRGKNKVDLKKLMSVSDNIANLNVERFKNFVASAEVAEGSSAAEMAAGIARPAVSVSLQIDYLVDNGIPIILQFVCTSCAHPKPKIPSDINLYLALHRQYIMLMPQLP